MAIRNSHVLIRIHTQPPRPSKFTSPPSYRLPERTSPIVSHIAEILPDRVLYLHFWTINSLSVFSSPLFVKYWPRRKSFSSPNRWKSDDAKSVLYGGWGITVHTSFASFSGCMNTWAVLSWRMVMSLMSVSGRLSRMSLFSFRRSWVYRSQSAGWPGSKSPQAGWHPDPPKDSGHNFPRRRSCPELPSSKRLRMFLLQWLPLRLGSIVANPWLVAGHHPAKELRVKLRRTKCEILERNVAS